MIWLRSRFDPERRVQSQPVGADFSVQLNSIQLMQIEKASNQFDCWPLNLVPKRGLEPPRLSALVPETSASTNSATWAIQESQNYIIEYARIKKIV